MTTGSPYTEYDLESAVGGSGSGNVADGYFRAEEGEGGGWTYEEPEPLRKLYRVRACKEPYGLPDGTRRSGSKKIV